MELTCLPIIVICCYIIGEIYKLVFRKVNDANKFIPVVTTICGGIISLVIYFTFPEAINAENIYEVLMIGFISGASATGTNQIIKKCFMEEI